MFVPHPTAENFTATIGPPVEPISESAEPQGLGDMVSSALTAIGITKERVSAVVGRPCGCGERQATLNSLGAKYLGLPEGSTAQNTDSPTPDSP